MSERPVVAGKAQKPSLCDAVLVTTRELIGGQREHAAIVTQVHGDDLVSVFVMPSGGQPYPIASVYHIRHSAAKSLSWRFPPRTRA